MSLQAYCFVASSSRVKWTPEKLRQIAELALPLLQLKEALMANPTLVRFLPSLRVFLLSSFVAEAKQKPRATTVMEEIAACEDDDDAALLWLSFRLGIDCCQKQWLPATNQILLLGHLKRAYSRGFDPLFADTFPLSILRILSNSIEALPANQVPAVLRVNRRFGGKICGAAIDNRGNLIESFVPNSLRIRFERSAQRTHRCAHFLLSPRQSQKSPFFPSSLPAVLRSPATITTRVTTVRSIWSENRGSWN